MYDVIIVGAGPAGASAGYFLGKRGISCLLLDRAKFPRDKPCGGGITPRAIKKFPFLKELMEVTTFDVVIHAKDLLNAYNEKSTEPLGYCIRRPQFDNDLLNMAKNSKIEVIEQQQVKKVDFFEDHIDVICVSEKKYSSRFLLGADGINSLVRYQTPLQKCWHKNKITLVFMNEIPCSKQIIEEYYSSKYRTHFHLGFGNSLGYGWIFPKKDHINIGFGEIAKPHEAPQILKRFHEFVTHLQNNSLLPRFSEQIKPPKAWTVQTGGPMKKCGFGRILLLGDAAGYVNPGSGEGIIYAIWSANIAADCIEKVINKKCSEDKLAEYYNQRCWKEFGADLNAIVGLAHFAFKHVGLLIKFANHDREIWKLMIALMDGSIDFRIIKRRAIKRVILGVLKGNFLR